MTQLPIQLDTRTDDAALPYGADQLSDDAILQRAEAILAARCVMATWFRVLPMRAL